MTDFIIVVQNAARLIVTAAILIGLWRGLARTTLSSTTRRGLWLTVTAVYVAWELAIEWLGRNGAFTGQLGVPLAIVLPLLIGLPILLRSKLVGRVLDAVPWQWLVGLQVYRVVGADILVTWAAGQAPTIFALPVGIGDVLTGLFALPAALSGIRGRAVAWNIFGLLDLVNAIALGVITTQLIAPGAPNFLGTYPLALIPAFAVPSSILLHALSLRQLRRSAAHVRGTADSTSENEDPTATAAPRSTLPGSAVS